MNKRAFGFDSKFVLLLVFVASVFLAFNFISASAYAATGDINVTVWDWTGSVINDAVVTVREASDWSSKGQDNSGEGGRYTIGAGTLAANGLVDGEDYYVEINKTGFGTVINGTSLYSGSADPNNAGTYNISSNIEILVRNSWDGKAALSGINVYLMNTTNITIAQGTTNASGYVTFTANFSAPESQTDSQFNNVSEIGNHSADEEGTDDEAYHFFVNISSGYVDYNSSSAPYNRSNATNTGLMPSTADMDALLKILVQDFSTHNITGTVAVFNDSALSTPVYNTSNEIVEVTNNGINITVNSSYQVLYYSVSKADYGGDSNSTVTVTQDKSTQTTSVVHIGANLLVLVQNSWGNNAPLSGASVYLRNESSNNTIAVGTTNATGYVEFVAKYDNTSTTSTDLFFDVTELRSATIEEHGYNIFVNSTGYATNNGSYSWYLSNSSSAVINTSNMDPPAKIVIQNFDSDNTTATVTVFNDSNLTVAVYNISNQIVSGTTTELNISINSSYPTLYFNVTKAGYGGELNMKLNVTAFAPDTVTNTTHIGPNLLIGVFHAWSTSTAVSSANVYLFKTSSNATIATGTTNSTGYVEFTAVYHNTSTTGIDQNFNGTELTNSSEYHLFVNISTYDDANMSTMNYTLAAVPESITVRMNDSTVPSADVWAVDSNNEAITQIYAANLTIKINTTQTHGIASAKYRIRNTTSNTVLVNWTDASADSDGVGNYTSASIDGVYLPAGNWTLDVNVTSNPGISNVTYWNVTANNTIKSNTVIQITAPTMTGSTSPGGNEITFDFTIVVKGNATTRHIQGYVDMSTGGTPFLAAPDVNNLYINSTTNATTRIVAVAGTYTSAQSLRLRNISSIPTGGLVPASTTNLTVMQMGVYSDTVRLHIVPYSGVSQGTYDGSYGFKWNE